MDASAVARQGLPPLTWRLGPRKHPGQGQSWWWQGVGRGLRAGLSSQPLGGRKVPEAQRFAGAWVSAAIAPVRWAGTVQVHLLWGRCRRAAFHSLSLTSLNPAVAELLVSFLRSHGGESQQGLRDQ